MKNPLLADEDIIWGISTIHMKRGASIGTLDWKATSYPDDDGEVTWSLNASLQGQRRRITTTKLQRQQTLFRKLLLNRDQKCVISGESISATLQAAHIVPVSEGGTDAPSNGVILRADLHLLYDDNAFEILPDGRFRLNREKLSDYYIDLLNSKTLSANVLEEVIEALEIKNQLPRIPR